MSYQQITEVLILVVAFALGIYDFVVDRLGGGEATISFVIWSWSVRYPALPFAFGFLCGHLFAQMRVMARMRGLP